ncbi:SDR family oxidoreductase [Nocardioides endophyticus]|uniref:SDR family oxidoreductase n=1 Tax=Nocardioides endophyticus TaxID=1353775 RepID=A0ABP8Z8U2_9ACTN
MKTYAVTGAASGIGAATTALLRERGHRVITVDRPGTDADLTADLATVEGRAAAVAGVQALTDVLHGLVPAAGIAGRTGVPGDLLVSVNFFGAVALVRGLQAELAAAKGAGVVLLASNSITGMPGWNAPAAQACLRDDEPLAREEAAKVDSVMTYPSSKAALAWWARREGVKPEWAGAGIRLNAVAPGATETPMVEEMRADPLLGSAIDAYPNAIGRLGRPEEVAATIAFLLSDGAANIVGAVIFVDGGTDAMLHPISPPGWEVGPIEA